MRVVVLAFAACAPVLASGCDDEADEASSDPQAKTTTLDERNDLARVEPTACEVRNGGADVRVGVTSGRR